ncbi:MAG: AI-2E family transporter [Lentimicrobiaceae bacterium]|jgi:predicted PurR-regulated permease PerM|nr:AI-2E family transporter [Lentimicrobiaceae bacterium]
MQDRYSSNNVFFRQLLYIVVLLVIGIVIFNQLKFFIGAFLGAITLYILLRPWQEKLSERRKWKSWIASLLLVSITTILFLALGFLLFEIVAAEIPAVDSSDIIPRLNAILKRINDATGFNIVPEKIISSSASTITNLVSSALNTTYSFAANMFMMLLILYFMLANFRKMESAVLLYIPFRGDSLKILEYDYPRLYLN